MDIIENTFNKFHKQKQQIKLLEKLAVFLAGDDKLKLCPYCKYSNCTKGITNYDFEIREDIQ